MLRHIPPVLSPELLYALAAMGHGDDIVIADANFPGESLGGSCIRLDGATATDVLEAVLRLLPLDAFDEEPVLAMEPVDEAETAPPILQEFQRIINATADHPTEIGMVDRFEFYERASGAFAVVMTGERRLYGNILLKKGVVAPGAMLS